MFWVLPCFSQLVDLKAELYRKQEQFKQEKLGQENSGAGFKLKSKDKVCVLGWGKHFTWLWYSCKPRTVFMFLGRNLIYGASRTAGCRLGLREMWSSWPRRRAASTQPGELSTFTLTVTAQCKSNPATHRFHWNLSFPDRRKLEEKAKLYEQMTKGDFPGWWCMN